MRPGRAKAADSAGKVCATGLLSHSAAVQTPRAVVRDVRFLASACVAKCVRVAG